MEGFALKVRGGMSQFDMRFRIREHVANLTPYSPGKPIDEVKREFGVSEVIKLASNENPLGPSPKAVKAFLASVEKLHLYPDASHYELKNAIAKKYGVKKEQIVVGDGSDELLRCLPECLIGPGDNVVLGDPSFPRYSTMSKLAGAELRKVPLDENARHDLKSMANAVDKNTRIVWIANPNNPTGTIVFENEVRELIKSIPENCIVALDEAYFDYATHSDYPNSLRMLEEGLPVVIFRTLSKTYGIAALRVGFAIMPEEIAVAMDKLREPFNLTIPAQDAAIAALEDNEFLARSVSYNQFAVKRLSEIVEGVGAKVTESFANFVWADFGVPARPLFDALLREGVITRTGDVFGCPNHMRISTGTEAQLETLRAAFDKVMAGIAK